MTEIRNRPGTSAVAKEYLRNFPLVYGTLKRVYRLFRQSDPTLQQQILKAIGNKKEVFFVQVGSNDGVQGDPIHDLVMARQGWRGIFIEPIEFLFRRLRKNYGESERFIFENVAISTKRETKKFYYVSEKARSERDLPYWHDQLGSFDRNHITKALGDEMSRYIIEENIDCQPLPDVLDRNRVDAIDLLHIDTEGFDYRVLSQVDLKRYKPSVILFEHHLLSDEEFNESRKLLRRTGYRILEYGNDTLALKRSFWIW
jgi:FkbM family methyltransferase